MEQQHLVQKFTFDVGFDSEEKAFEFQNDFAAFAKEHILALAEEIFTELGGDINIRINKLELDLGEIPFRGFEEETYYRFREKLKDKLKLLLKGYTTSDREEKVEIVSRIESELQLLAHFLTYGILPWSARKNNPDFTVNKLLANLIETNPAVLKKYLSDNINQSDFRKRVVRQMEDEILWSAIRLFAKTEESVFRNFYTEITNTYRKKAFVCNTFSEFRELIWNFIITYVIVQKKSTAEASTILESFIHFIPTYAATSLEKAVESVYLALLNSLSFTASLEKAMSEERIPVTFEDHFVKFIKGDPAINKIIEAFKSKRSDSINERNTDKNKRKEGIDNEEASPEEPFEVQLRKRREEQTRQREQRVYNFLMKIFELPTYGIQIEFSKEELVEIEKLIKEFAVTNPVLLRRVIANAKFDIGELGAQKFLSIFHEEILEVFLPEVFKMNASGFSQLAGDSERKAIIQFIETGYFPYSIFLETLPKKEIQKIFARLFNTEVEINKLKEAIAKSFEDKERRALKMAQFKKFLPEIIIKKYFSLFESISVERMRLFDEGVISLDEIKDYDAAIFFIQYFIKEKTLPPATSFTFAALVEKLVTFSTNKSVVYFTLLKDNELKFVQKNVSTERAVWIKSAIKELKDKTVSSNKQEDNLEDQEEIGQNKKKEPGLLEEENVPEPMKVQMGDPIYINNAGLVIFNPYLPRFFKMLGLIEKRDFIDEYSAHKAAHILQYLADKTENKEEHDLTLNKLMCGIELHVPLIKDIEITEEDKKTCDSLIEGVIQNWTILKSTSIDNFRISFLMREGRLMLEPKGWKLKVEERGYDILVEKIPWSISMIKLPWMKKIIYVEWK